MPEPLFNGQTPAQYIAAAKQERSGPMGIVDGSHKQALTIALDRLTLGKPENDKIDELFLFERKVARIIYPELSDNYLRGLIRAGAHWRGEHPDGLEDVPRDELLHMALKQIPTIQKQRLRRALEMKSQLEKTASSPPEKR